MHALLAYLVEFCKDDTMLSKMYLQKFALRNLNCQLIIMIITNETLVITNNGL